MGWSMLQNPAFAFCKQRKSFRRLPGRVPHFDDERVVGEALQKRGEMRDSVRRAMKRERELQQHCAEFARSAQNVEPSANRALILFCRRDDRRAADAVAAEVAPE